MELYVKGMKIAAFLWYMSLSLSAEHGVVTALQVMNLHSAPPAVDRAHALKIIELRTKMDDAFTMWELHQRKPLPPSFDVFSSLP
jgi:hypothetical protein